MTGFLMNRSTPWLASLPARCLALCIALLPVSQALAADSDIYERKGVAVRGADVVAYFSLIDGQDAVIGKDTITAQYAGTTWRFSSTENRDRFIADPERYVPRYGGFCAYAVANGDTARIDPDAWHINDGKLYLNYSKRIGRKWLGDRDHYIQQADQKWPELNRDCLASGGCS